MTNTIRKVDQELEEVVFNDAKKDKVAKSIYEEIISLKRDFDVLIDSVQQRNKLKNQTNEVQQKIEDFKIKYKNMS